MATKRRKDVEVGEVYHEQAGVRSKIFLTPDNTFHATCNGRLFRNISADALRSEVNKFAGDSMSLEWRQIIEVKMLVPFARPDTDYMLSFDCKTYLIAKNASGRWMQKEVGDEDGFMHEWGWSGQQELILPCRSRNNDRATHFLPYSEAVWQGLNALREVIKGAKLKLLSMLSTNEGLAQIAGAAQTMLLLPAPPADDVV